MANSLLHEPQKLIIDTDPGIDDSIAIMMAFESSELKIIGMTTIFEFKACYSFRLPTCNVRFNRAMLARAFGQEA
ncbi:hypothetical protein AAHE18_12G153600 [Arachis hypogaea]